MDCYICGHDTRVVNSRSQSRLNQVWRRRLCSECKYIFTTVEKIDLGLSMSVKLKDGSISPFLKEKLLISVNDSLGHRSNHLIEAIPLTDTIISKLHTKNKNSLFDRGNIISTVLEVLKNFDNTAANYYSSYHND